MSSDDPADSYRAHMDEPTTPEEREALERWQRQYGTGAIHPRGTDWRNIFRRIWAPIAALLGLAVKFGDPSDAVGCVG